MAEAATRVVLITVDSLRADALGLYGAEQATPALDAFGREAAVFEWAFATASHTTQSFPGILASNYPTTGSTVQTLGDRLSVAECFQAEGFRTAGFHSNPLLSRRRGYGRGFDEFWDSTDRPDGALTAFVEGRLPGWASRTSGFLARRCPPLFRLARGAYRAVARRMGPIVLPYVCAEEINRRAMGWLPAPHGREERAFLWLHYMDPHWPYATRLPGLSRSERVDAALLAEKALRRPWTLSGREINRLRHYYHLEVRYVDACLGRLLDFLRRDAAWDRTAVFLTADHGDSFAEHGLMLHGDLLYDELIRVPLMVRAPGVAPGWRTGLASLIDLAPAICHVAGLRPLPCFEGRSLLEGEPREAVFAETAYRTFHSDRPRRAAVRTAEWKLIRDAEQGKEELYDVRTDPREARSVLGERPDAAARMRELLESHVARPRPVLDGRPLPPVRPEEDEAVKARLRALGYMDEADGGGAP